MLFDDVLEAVEAIRRRTPVEPLVGLILGSGLGDLANEIQNAVTLPYDEIPHFAHSTVLGHVGQLLIGRLEHMPVLALQGRVHMYEGYDPAIITLPVRVMRLLGAQTLIVSNAAGGVNPAYRPGDFMTLRDHIFMPGMAGRGPLVGIHDERLGERFPPMAGAYDQHLRALAHTIAQKHPEITLHEGVYTMVAGPNYETPAELTFLRTIGTDAVGMSTVPEVIVARQVGLRVLGLSLITNMATGNPDNVVNHAEVLSTADAVRGHFATLVKGIISQTTSML
jgi:purine-nucleoside phosphorylase